MSHSVKAILACLLGYTIFGFSFLFSSVALRETTPFVLLSLRFLTAFVVLNIVLAARKIPVSLKGKPIMRLLLMGLLEPVLYFIFESYGISMTSSSFSGIMIGLVPVAGLIFGAVFLREACTAFQVCCTVLSVIGVIMTTTGGLGTVSLQGFLFLLGAVITASLFAIVSRSVAPYFSAFERTYVMSLLGSIVFTAAALIQTRGNIPLLLAPLTSVPFCTSLLYLSVVSSVGAFTLINYSLNHLSAGHALIFANFTSVVSLVAGILIMHDSFTSIQFAGILLILVSVFGVSYQKRSPAHK